MKVRVRVEVRDWIRVKGRATEGYKSTEWGMADVEKRRESIWTIMDSASDSVKSSVVD
jgi:hypothetical protein